MKSLSRSTLILRALAERPRRPSELSRELGKPWATIYRTVRVLTDEEILRRDPDTGAYALGPTMWSLASTYGRDHAVLGVGLGYLEQMLPQVPGLLKVTERCAGEAVTLFNEQNPQATSVRRIHAQYRLPLHGASFGHVLLAHSDEEFLEEYLSLPLPRVTPGTITDAEALRERVAQIREHGYAISRGELQAGNSSVSAPIFSRRPGAIAALSVVVPIEVVEQQERCDELVRLVRTTALLISESLGWRSYHPGHPTGSAHA
ncbi:IclR family transcriptional regulator [Nocardioides sp. LHG3406-4]|uniref:IclR family transcriptional regulator n=1 Tax=Nocardioides sp. LHG3406-4 TaxID=2804575 RepID=UPI003CEA1930